MAFQGMSEAEFDDLCQQYQSIWGVSMVETRQYASEILTSSYYAQAIQMPGIWQNRGGSFLALSTKDSTRCMKGNWEDIRRGHLITHPAWLEYEVYFFQDLVCLNVTGMLQTRHQGQSVGKLGWVLDQLCATSYPDWHLRHCLISAGYFAQSLRDLLGRIGIPLWIEYTSGFSWQAYRALDLYVRPLVPGMPPPEFGCLFFAHRGGWSISSFFDIARELVSTWGMAMYWPALDTWRVVYWAHSSRE